LTSNNLPTWLLEVKVEGIALSRRERQVLRLLARGLTMEEAAAELGIARETVRTQARYARAKLRARNITHAVAIAISLDLI
jgi:DNA-binding CsgD family transcriptional regulator